MLSEPPALSTRPEFSGHLWVQERPTGGHLAVRLTDAGALSFQTPEMPAPTMQGPGLPYTAAVRFIRNQIARAPLKEAVPDPTTVALIGIATWAGGVDYDWHSIPPFVGTDVYRTTADRSLPPDRATAVFERLGLPAAPAVARELPTRQFDPTQYDAPGGFPQSAWAGEPAAAVLVRDKTDTSAIAWRVTQPPAVDSLTVAACLEQYGTPDRIQQTARTLREAGTAVTVDAVRDRLLETIVREQHARLLVAGDADTAALADQLAERVHRHLD